MRIRILPPEVASQIAAGEVIERPASVVKELIENSLDAGAKQIKITIEGAGKRLIEVIDDGAGIPADQLELAVSRHATSKLNNVEDLHHIHTLGFRGEALASIASVARLSISSRTVDEEIGMQKYIEGGRGENIKPIGIPVGTIVKVEDLFYNVPARYKFLKHETTERRYIDALVTRYALAYPHIRIQLIQENRTVFHTVGNGDRREVLASLYGVQVAKQMIEINHDEHQLRVSGFISPISISRSNRQDLHFFINGRPVIDPTLTTAVIKAYHTLLMVGRYPMVIILIDLPTELVDVNVHPTKAEVRFSNAGEIFSHLQRIVRSTLLAHSPVPQINGMEIWRKTQAESSIIGFPDSIDRADTPEYVSQLQPGTEISSTSKNNDTIQEQKVPLLRLVGQIALTYLVAEGPDGLYLIDQHAAHERVLFENYMKQKTGKILNQVLLKPEVVELQPAQSRLINENLTLINQLGFQVESFGTSTFLVRSIPSFLTQMLPADALRAVVEKFEEDETPLKGELENILIARICKRAAVKAGQVLTLDEQRALLAGLEACQSPRTCPHGRPTMIHLSVDLLQRQFGRRSVG